VENWQNRPLAAAYPIIYLDAIHLKLRRDGKVQNTAVYVILGIDCEGQRDVLGHWVSDGGEGANFWLSVGCQVCHRGALVGGELGGPGDDVRLYTRHSAADLHDQALNATQHHRFSRDTWQTSAYQPQ
jgi:hypothetical protein